jgi:hypothetical protein
VESYHPEDAGNTLSKTSGLTRATRCNITEDTHSSLLPPRKHRRRRRSSALRSISSDSTVTQVTQDGGDDFRNVVALFLITCTCRSLSVVTRPRAPSSGTGDVGSDPEQKRACLLLTRVPYFEKWKTFMGLRAPLPRPPHVASPCPIPML